MARTIVGLFDDRDDAERAVRDLSDNGFDRKEISVVASDPEGRFKSYKIDQEGNLAGEGAGTGAATGAVVGGVLGLLIGAGPLAWPAAGLVAVGPVVGMLTGIGVGAVSGGIVGALVGWGIPEEHAETYAEAVRRGSVLVMMRTANDSDAGRIADILDRDGAVDVEQRRQAYTSQGWTRYDQNAPIYTSSEATQERSKIGTSGARGSRIRSYDGDDWNEDEMNARFRSHFDQNYASSDGSYDRKKPAYEHGARMARNDWNSNRSWDEVEAEARSDWERLHPGTWDQNRDAVREGWSCAVSQRTNRASMR